MADQRNLKDAILRDLEKKFVFLAGPRQVGKTTFARSLIRSKNGLYLLYDDAADREKILQKQYMSQSWVCLDEFHKFPRWKSHIKGTFDKYHETLHLILTGSAKLDVFQKSGDSLFGRYYLHHLHPFTCGELNSKSLPSLLSDVRQSCEKSPHLQDMLALSGFPEPLFSQSSKEYKRWSIARRQLLIQQDMRELSQINLLALIEHLMLILPQRIGSLFSYRSLSEDIKVSTPTIQNWLEIFQRLFIVYKILPYTRSITRSLQKQPKYYLYDWSQISDAGARFENFVASHLWKATQIWTDLGEAELSLHFIRDRDRREVDFLMVKDGQPWFLLEAKLSDPTPSENLKFFSNKLHVPAIQLVQKSGVHQEVGNITIISADRWLGLLP